MSKNRQFFLNMQAITLIIYGASILPSVYMSYRYQELDICTSMLIISIGSILFGIISHRILNNEIANVPLRVCYLTTVTVWLSVIFLSTLPYLSADMGYSFIDCLYTATASWTTCGTTAISIEELPPGLLLWRSTCNWMGGIGIILLALTFLPSWQFIGQRLASTEIRGPRFLMSNITFRKAYRRIMFIYLGFTALQYLALRVCGMPKLPSLLTALSNTSTSGLLHLNGGVIIAFPASIKIVVSTFAFLSSINVSVFVLIVYGRFSALKCNTELKFYLSYVVIITLAIAGIITYERGGAFQSSILGTILMQVVSFTSTAGFVITDCYTWSAPCVTLVIIIMFIGSCAISTGGGIKISRVCMAMLNMRANMFKTMHPRGVRDIKYNGELARSSAIARVNVYILLFMVIFFLGSLVLTIDGTSVIDALAYSQAMLTNTGTPVTMLSDPGIIAQFSTLSKMTLCFLMLCGRLEIYPVLLLFYKGFIEGIMQSDAPPKMRH